MTDNSGSKRRFSYIALNVPKLKKLLVKILPYIGGILGFVVSSCLHNRALAFGFLLALFVVYVLNHKKTLKFIVAGLIVLTAILLSMIFFIKSDSSLGRMLIYKISFQVFKDDWITGIGLGNFKKIYLYEQAKYFGVGGNYTDKELLLADNTHYAFNDYWQLVIELGISSCIGLVVMLYFLCWLLYRASQLKQHKVLTSNVMLSLITVLAAAFFTHIFDKLICQAITVCCLGYLCFVVYDKKWQSIFAGCIAFVLLLASGLKGIDNYRIKNNYEAALKLYMAGLKNECRAELLKIYPIQDHKRAVLYLQVLMFSYQLKYEKEINFFLKQYPNANTYKLLGDFYFFNDKIKAAENAYLMAINMVPNRFLPRRSLLQLYISQKKHAKAKEVAKRIISLCVKIDSKQVNDIKYEAVNFLNNQ